MAGGIGHAAAFPLSSPYRFVDAVGQQKCQVMGQVTLEVGGWHQGKAKNEALGQWHRFHENAGVFLAQARTEFNRDRQFMLPAVEKAVSILGWQGFQKLFTVI